jgi:acetylornithine/succinyldiaminopimelate/putrescine aminotransferase
LAFIVDQTQGLWVHDPIGAPRMEASAPERVLPARHPVVCTALATAIWEVGLTHHVNAHQLAAEALLVDRTPFDAAVLTNGARQAVELAIATVPGNGPVLRIDAGQAIDVPAGTRAVVAALDGTRGLAPEQWLVQLRDACVDAGAAWIADETRCGLGRTGKLFGYQHDPVLPDRVALGDALGGSTLSAGAVLGPRDALQGHACVEGRSPLNAIAAHATLTVLRDERLVERVADLGSTLIAGLRGLQEEIVRVERESDGFFSPGMQIAQVDGLGLLAFLSLKENVADQLVARLADKGLYVCASAPDTLRISPPLTLHDHELDWLIGQLRSCIWT